MKNQKKKSHAAALKRLIFVLLLMGSPGNGVPAIATDCENRERPNIILVLIDDLGWADVGCYGNEFVETPHIDQLAKQGIRFTDCYAAGAVCSPTRCAIQSGQTPARIGITAHTPGHWRPFEKVITPQTTMALPRDTITIAESLKRVGYQTGYVGKWHLGSTAEFMPDKQGYDFSAVINGPHFQGKYRVQGRKDLKPKFGQYRTEFEADLCVDFIGKNKSKPFFLMVSPFAVHIPLGAMSTKVEKYRRKAEDQNQSMPHPVYAAMIEHCDDLVGRILDAVDSNGLSDQTLVVFTSDNGGLYRRYDYRKKADDTVASMAPLKGEKGTLFEGGIRVPMIIKYPPVTKAGGVCSEPAISHDLYPTFISMASGKLPESQTIDGWDLTPILKNPNSQLGRKSLVWHYPHYHHDRPASCIRAGDWKLIEYLDGTGEKRMYNLKDDIGETTNLVAENKIVAANLQLRLENWRKKVIARMPIHNPSYDPSRAGEWWSRRSGKPIESDSRKRFPQTEKDL